MSRTTFTVTHAEHVVGEDGIARPTGRTFEVTDRCADPATCGSEFQSSDADSLTVTCIRCGLKGTVDLDACVPLDAHGAQA